MTDLEKTIEDILQNTTLKEKTATEIIEALYKYANEKQWYKRVGEDYYVFQPLTLEDFEK